MCYAPRLSVCHLACLPACPFATSVQTSVLIVAAVLLLLLVRVLLVCSFVSQKQPTNVRRPFAAPPLPTQGQRMQINPCFKNIGHASKGGIDTSTQQKRRGKNMRQTGHSVDLKRDGGGVS